MRIRLLTRDDAAAYRELRLASLRDHPEAFTTDASEEESLPLEEFQKRAAGDDSTFVFGALDGERLVGIATLVRPTKIRQRFRAMIAGMYVSPPHRRQGVARALIEAAIERARTLPELEEVCLCVTCGNDSARRLYVACGFEPECIDPRYYKYDGKYYDLEWLRLPLG